MTAKKNQLKEKVDELQRQTRLYIAELKKVAEKIHLPKNSNVVSYFTSSLNISHKLEHESLCLGSYHIWNIGNVPLTNPSITIKLPEDSPFSFTGRYVYNHFQQSLKRPNEWLRIKNDEEKETFSFKPLEKTILEPNERISFENFQIKWSPNTSYAGSITGFTYCEQFQDGIAVINPINLSVISLEEE